ncbi:MAG: hypothetical protein J6C41_01895 [Oscillospiraceae bacterium]|nr:hypothetical protein [Oscillospiraceae bacterium]
MKENCYKRIIAMLLAFTLLLPLLSVGATEEKSTIAVDGTDWTGWTAQMGGANQMTLSAEDGKMTVGVPGGSKAGDHVVFSSVSVPVKPDTTYDISYTLSQQGIQGVTAWVRVFEQNVTPVDMLATYTIYAKDAGTVTATGQYTSGSDVEYAIIWVVAMNAIDQPTGTDGTVVLDDLSIQEQGAEPEPEPTPESQIDIDGKNWTGWTAQMGGANQMTLSAEDGKMTVGVPGGSKAGDHVVFSSASVPVKPNTTYDISYTLSHQGIQGVTAWVRVFEQNVTPVDMLATCTIYAKDAGTVTATGQYTSGSDVEYAIIWVVAMNAIDQPADTDGTVVLDDLVIWEHVDEPETTEPETTEPETTEPETTEPETTEPSEPLPVTFDGGFETVSGNAFTNWFPGNSANALSVKPGTVANSGSYAAMFSGGAQGYQDITSAALEVKPDTTYDISYYVKNVDFIGATGYVSVFKNGDPGAPIGKLDLLPFFVGDSSFGTDWKQLKGQFTTDSETTSVVLRFTVHTWAVASDTTGKTLYIDDVAVEEMPVPPLANDGSFDSGFEIVDPNYNTLPNWALNNTASNAISATAGTDAHSGNSSLQLMASEKGTYQQIVSNPVPVEPNTTYDLSYFVKNAGLIGGTGYLSVFADSGEMLGKEDLDGSVFYIADENYPTDWQQLRTQFTTGENTGSVLIRITVHTHAAGDTVSGSVLIDDLSVAIAPDPPMANDGSFDGSFEIVDPIYNILANWTLSNTASNAISATAGTQAHSGNSSLQFTATQKGTYQQVLSNAYEVEPNVTYELSYFVKNAGLIGATGYVSVFSNGTELLGKEDLEGSVFYISGNSYGSAWNELKPQFTTKEDTTFVVVRFTVHTHAAEGAVSGSVYLDDVTVKVAPPPPKANTGTLDGGFELYDSNHNILTNWTMINKAPNAIAATPGREVHGGSRSLQFTANSKGTYQELLSNRIDVEADALYDISYFMKNAGLIGATGYLTVYSNGRDVIGEKIDLDGSVFFIGDENFGTDWRQLKSQIRTLEDTRYLIVKITLHTHAAEGSVSGSVYLDDLTVGEHVHVFDQMDYHDQYLAAMATEESPTLFYYSCFCGEIGTETFSYGEPLPKPTEGETQPPVQEPTEPMPQQEEENNILWIVLGGLGAAAVVVCLIVLVIRKKKRK